MAGRNSVSTGRCGGPTLFELIHGFGPHGPEYRFRI
jgi:hypothetical protein